MFRKLAYKVWSHGPMFALAVDMTCWMTLIVGLLVYIAFFK